jgi:protein-tyrosine phosphatase
VSVDDSQQHESPEQHDLESGRFDRVIRFPGSHNVRDLGGLTTTSGKQVRRGRLFRSEYPGYAGEPGADAVETLRLATVVDLRRGSEIRFERLPWEELGVTWHHHALSAGKASSWEADYRAYFESGPDAVAAAVSSLIAPGARPALFHCAAGKDRTGVIAALLLSLLDVEPDQIVADYVLTEKGLREVLTRLSTGAPYLPLLSGWTVEKFTPRADTMRGLLAWLDDQGGAESWLVGHGVSPADIEAFRAEVLAD